MSSQLHELFQNAKAGYASLAYDGDLATDLLRPRRAMWALPLIGGAIAALVAMAFWPRPTPPTNVAPVAVTSHAKAPTFALALPRINYEVHVDAVDASVRECVHVLHGNLDKALASPIVTRGVETVDEVTDNLKEMASNTWAQMQVVKPPC